MKRMIPKEFIEQVKSKADILEIVSEYVDLIKHGQGYKGFCPFHKEKTPSFTVAPAKGIYKCFGCGRGGNVFSFIQNVESKSFPATINYLAQRYGLTENEQIGSIYVLELEQGKYYVGFSTNIKKRLLNHFNGNGAAWTKKYKPLSLIKTFENFPIELENEITERYMKKFGYKNVRGGNYCFLEMKYTETPENYRKKKYNGVYILKLEKQKYYVGYDSNMERSIDKHFDGNGCKWTQKFKPVEVLKTFKTLNSDTHKQMTLAVMSEFGWENVRGYRWTDIQIQKPKELIK